MDLKEVGCYVQFCCFDVHVFHCIVQCVVLHCTIQCVVDNT